MDFKSLITKISSMDDEIKSVAAPQLPKTVQLNEDAELRVLAGTSSYIAEAKKKADEEVKEEMKVGDKRPSATGGTIEKTATGIKHHAGNKYGGEKAPKDEDDEDAPKSKKKAKKESIDPEVFKSKFLKMVEGKKSKPDFLDMDKDGNKKEPMKKAVADKKKGAVKEAAKPDYIDLDKDGNKKEAMKKAAADAKKAKGKVDEGKDEGKPGKNFAKIAKKAAKEYGSKAAGERVAGAVRKKVLAKESKIVAESVEQKLTFKDMVRLVQESGGQQQIDAIDTELFNWAQRVARNKLGEGMKADLYAGLIYERNGGVFEMYDVLSEDQK